MVGGSIRGTMPNRADSPRHRCTPNVHRSPPLVSPQMICKVKAHAFTRPKNIIIGSMTILALVFRKETRLYVNLLYCFIILSTGLLHDIQ